MKPLHVLLLQILSAVGEPMLIKDMLAVKALREHSLEDIHTARCELLDWFLIEQRFEMVSVHTFLGAYFRDQLSRQDSLLNSIASDFGHYAYEKAMELNSELTFLPLKGHPGHVDEDLEIQLSNEIFRYAVPAGKLLMSIGEDKLAQDLPIRIRGTLREMVFYYYQEKRDYTKAREYAEKWLKISPNDLEILLFQARCYRNQRDVSGLEKAEMLIMRLENADNSKRFAARFAARIYREKALIAQFRGDIETAKNLFRKGIEIHTPYPYPENRTGLAQLLLREAEELPYWSSNKDELVGEALQVLEKAREGSPIFDRFHLGTYIEALILAGQDETALPLLEQALRDREDDERLNYRMAEILRKKDILGKATDYARKAIAGGAQKAYLTLANILYSESQRLINEGDEDSSQEKLKEALNLLSLFRPEFGHDQEVSDAIASKVYRAMGDYATAREHVDKYQNTGNPYTIYEQCRIAMGGATSSITQNNYTEALTCLDSAKRRIEIYKLNRELSEPLQTLLGELLLEEERIRRIMNQ